MAVPGSKKNKDEYFEFKIRFKHTDADEVFMYWNSLLERTEKKLDIPLLLIEKLLRLVEIPDSKLDTDAIVKRAESCCRLMLEKSRGGSGLHNFRGHLTGTNEFYGTEINGIGYTLLRMVYYSCRRYETLLIFNREMEQDKNFCIKEIHEALKMYSVWLAPEHAKMITPNRVKFMTAVIAYRGYGFRTVKEFEVATNAELADSVRNATGEFKGKK